MVAITAILVVICYAQVYGQDDQEKNETFKAFKFDWPVPGKVKVTESVFKKGRNGKLQYFLVIKPTKNAYAEIHYKDLKILELEGVDLSSPVVRKQLAPMLEIMKVLPAFQIDKKGNLVKVLGMDAVIEAMLKILTPKQAKEIETLVKSPTFINTIKNKIADYWRQWVGFWVGLEISEGESIEAESEMEFMGMTLNQPILISHEGALSNQPGMIRLKIETLLEGKQVIESLIKWIQKGRAEAGLPKEDIPIDIFKNAKRITTIELITNPRNLRPNYVKSEQIMTIKVKGGKAKAQIERHEYRFDWSVNKRMLSK